MAYSVKGISIKIGADTTEFSKGIKKIKNEVAGIDSTMRDFKKSYSFNKDLGNSFKNLSINQALVADKFKNLKKQQSLWGEGLRAAESSLKKYNTKLTDARNEVTRLENAMKTGTGSTKENAEALEQAKEKVAKYEKSVEQSERQVLRFRAGVQGLTNQMKGLSTEFISTNNAVLKQYATLKRVSSLTDKLASATKWLSIGSAATIAASIATTMSYEDAWAGVLKTVEGTPQQLERVNNGLKQLATTTASSYPEIAKFAELGGQMGIATDSIVGFTKTITMLNDTTNLLGEEGAQQIAKFANIMAGSQGQTNEYFERLGSTIVDLGNNFATTENDIMTMSMRIAPMAKVIGLTEQEVLALSTALSSVGMKANAGGGAMSKWLGNINTMVATGSEDLQKWANVAGMSAEEFTQAWQTNPMQAFQTFIHGLGKYGNEGSKILAELGVNEIRASQAFLALASNSDILDSALAKSNGAWAENTAMVNEAQKRYGTMKSQAIQTFNAIKNSAADLGSRFAPYIKNILSALKSLADGYNSLSDSQKDFVAKALLISTAISPVNKVISKLSGGFAGLIGKIGSTAMSFEASASGIEAFAGGSTMASKGLTLMSKGLTTLQGVVVPVTAGIVALVAVYGTLIGKYKEAQQAIREELIQKDADFEATVRLTEAYGEWKTNLESTISEADDMVASYKANARTADILIDKIGQLNGKEKLNASQKALLKEYVDQLNSIYPDLALKIDETTGKLTEESGVIGGNTQKLQENVEKWKELAEAQAYVNALKKYIEAQAEAQIEVEALQQQYDSLQTKIEDMYNYAGQHPDLLPKDHYQKIQALQDEQDEVNAKLKESKKTLSEIDKQVDVATDKVENSQTAQKVQQDLKKISDAAKKYGAEIPKGLEESISKGKVNVDTAIENMADLKAFQDRALAECNVTGAQIPQWLAEGILSGQYSVDEAMEMLKASLSDDSIGIEGADSISDNFNNRLKMNLGKVDIDKLPALDKLQTSPQIEKAATGVGTAFTSFLSKSLNGSTNASKNTNKNIVGALSSNKDQVQKAGQGIGVVFTTALNNAAKQAPIYMKQVSNTTGVNAGYGSGGATSGGRSIGAGFMTFSPIISKAGGIMRRQSQSVGGQAASGAGLARSGGMSLGNAFLSGLQGALARANAIVRSYVSSMRSDLSVATQLANQIRNKKTKKSAIEINQEEMINFGIVPNMPQIRSLYPEESRLGEITFAELSPRRQAMYQASMNVASLLGNTNDLFSSEVAYPTKAIQPNTSGYTDMSGVISRLNAILNAFQDLDLTINLQPATVDGRALTDVVTQTQKIRDMLNAIGKGNG